MTENRDITVGQPYELHTICYISIYVLWSGFGAYCYVSP